MLEDSEIPEVCNQYDLIDEIITETEENIQRLQDENQKLIEQIKEAIQIVKDAQEINETSEYFRQKIKEIDSELLKNEADIKAKSESLFEHWKSRNELSDLVQEAGMTKISGFGTSSKWITYEVYEQKYKNVFLVSRLV